jgi:hypothetical protein
MEKRKNVNLYIFLIAVFIGALACGRESTEDPSKSSIVINSPADGSNVTLGVELFVVSTSFANEGVSRVELGINGQALSADAPVGNPETYVANMSWIPMVEGAAIISVVVYDARGDSSDPVLITVQVVSQGGLPSPGPGTIIPPTITTVPPTPYPTNTPYPTYTLYPTHTPTPSPTTHFSLPTSIIVVPGIFPLPAVETVQEVINIGPGATGTITANCPSDSIVVSGGFSTHPLVLVYRHTKSDNGWNVAGKNNHIGFKKLYVYAHCLKNTSGSIVMEYKDVTVSGGGIEHEVVKCPVGFLMTGGGWSINSDGSLAVIESSIFGHRWAIEVENKVGSNRSARVYVLCLSGTNGVISYFMEDYPISGNTTGYVTATCTDSINVGGGFRGNRALYVYATYQNAPGQWVVHAQNNSSISKLLDVDALCLSFP